MPINAYIPPYMGCRNSRNHVILLKTVTFGHKTNPKIGLFFELFLLYCYIDFIKFRCIIFINKEIIQWKILQW
jgi:hypothetical protein